MASNSQITALIDQIAKQGEAWKNGADGAREGLMNSCQQLYSNLVLPAENIILTQWAQPTHTAVIRLASEIQLFEALAADNGAPKSSKNIAQRTQPQTEDTLVARMLRHLSAMGDCQRNRTRHFRTYSSSLSYDPGEFQRGRPIHAR